MNIGSLGFSLFDLLGYLIPGYILLFAFFILSNTINGSVILKFETLENYPLLSIVIAYFTGQICHSFASIINNAIRKIIRARNAEDHNEKMKLWKKIKCFIEKQRIGGEIFEQVKKEIISAYDIPLEKSEKLNSLELYLLADSFLVASGYDEERKLLLIREGFYKTSSFAFFLVGILSCVCISFGGILISNDLDKNIIGIIGTVSIALLSFVISIALFDRYCFFNRVKINNTFLMFLAFRKKN